MKENSHLPKTKAAIEAYDLVDKAARDLFESGNMDMEQFLATEKDLDAAVLKVKEAFAEETSNVNSRERAMLVHPGDLWLRRSANVQSVQS